MIVAPLFLSVLVLAGAQHVSRQGSDLASWASEYPELVTPRISERAFRENKEYRYLYDGQILTGLPETADQYSGLRIRAIVTVQLRSGVDVLKIEKATLGKLNERNIDGPLSMQDASAFDELTGEEAKEWNTALTKPIRFDYDDKTGAVTDLVSLETDPFWSVNIKRSILATFNLKLKSESAEILSHPRFTGPGRQQPTQRGDEDTEYFSVMEEGIGGECEAVYLVQSLPTRDVRRKAAASVSGASIDEALNVTKSWNYDNCKSRPIFLESLNSGAKCVGKKTTDERERTGCTEKDTKKENIINSASHTRYSLVGTADDFMIESAVTEAVHKFAPYSAKAGSMTAYVNATLRLIYAGEWSRNTILPTEQGISVRGLRQMLPQDHDDENRQAMFRDSTSDRSARFQQSRQGAEWPNVSAKKTIVKALLDRLVEDLADSEVEPESANLVLQMSVILKYATHEEIAEIHREVKGMAHQSFEKDQIENLWFDVLALTGTKPAVLYIKREIISGNLNGERAAQLLNTLAFSIAKPDQDIVQEVLTLCKQSAVAGHSGMRKACWLSLGTLAHASCVDDVETTTSVQNNAVKNGSPKCNSESRRRLVVELLARMKTVQTQEDQILLLKTVGNTGFVEAVQDLKSIIEDKQESTIIRINAIYALTRVAASYPELVQAVVLPIFHDQNDQFQVRIAAFDLAIEAEADLPDLQLIARSLHHEKSKQVGSYVWSKLNSLANATHPCFEELADNAALALEFGTPFNTGLTYSKAIHLDGYSDALEVGGFAEIETIGDSASIVPRQISARLNAHVFGLSHDVIEAGVETTGITNLIKKFAMSRGKQSNVLAELFGDYDGEDQNDDDEDRRQGGQQSVRTAGGRHARQSHQRREFDEFNRLLGLTARKDEEIEASAYIKIFGHEVRFMTLSPKAILKSISEAYLKPSEFAGLARGDLSIDHRKALMAADAEWTIPTELGLPLTVELKAPVVVSVKGTVGLKIQPELSLASLVKMPQAVTVESDVKVSVASEMHWKMNVWAAYVKIGAGMRAQISTVIPLNGDLTVDLKTGKIETTMDLPKEPLELIKLEVIPITFTKSVPKTLVPHQPDRQDDRSDDRSEKTVEYNQQPLDNAQPSEFFRFKTDLMENPFMLSKNGRPSTKFYEGLAVPVLEIKEISSFDILKTKTVSMRVGHPAAGFVLDVEGQYQMANGVPNMPMLPVGGKNKVSVTLRPTQSGLKSVSAALHFRQEHSLSSARPTYTKLVDQMVDFNSASLLGRLTSDLPAAFSKDDKSAYSTQLIIKGHTDSRQDVAMQGVFSFVRGMNDKFVKIAAELTSEHQAMPYQACVNGHAQYPEEYDAWNLTPATNKPVTGRVEFAAGRSCNAVDAAKVKVSFGWDKNAEQLSMEKNDVYSIRGSVIPQIESKTVEPMAHMLKPVWQECDDDRKQGARWSPACETVKDLYSQLMQLKVDIDYQNIPRSLKVVLDKAEQMTHSLFLWNSDIDNVDIQNTPNHITVWANFSGTEDIVDIVYSTPKKNAKLVGLPVPYPLGPIEADDEPLNFWEALLDEDLDDMCSASGNRVNTLDSATLQVSPSRCWALLAKDCSEEQLWSVMYAQAGSRGAEGKKVLVFIGDKKIELQPANAFASGRQLRSSGDVTVVVNGQQIQLKEQEEATEIGQDIEISMETDGDATAPYVAISAEEYGLELWYDGHNVAVKPTQWLRKQVCGLCGNDNGEEWDDMTLPNGQLAGNDEDLFRGYTAQKDGCDAEQYSETRSASQARYPYALDQEECGQLKTIVKSRPGKVCFSVDPVKVCAAGCNGAEQDDSSEEYIEVRRAGFHCLPEDSSLAQRLTRDARSRVLSEISMKPVTDYFVVPQGRAGCSNNGSRSTSLNMQQRRLRA